MSIHIIFDGPPGHQSGRFIEVEDSTRASIGLGGWRQSAGGFWELVIPDHREMRKALEQIKKHLLQAHPYCTAEDQAMARVAEAALEPEPDTKPCTLCDGTECDCHTTDT